MLFYVALGVLPSASQAEIRHASRVLREQYLPVEGADKKRYNSIVEASNCLCDPDLRKEYNKIGPDAIRKHQMVEGRDPMKEIRDSRTPGENNKFDARRKEHHNEVHEMRKFQEKQAAKKEKRDALMKVQEEGRAEEQAAKDAEARSRGEETEEIATTITKDNSSDDEDMEECQEEEEEPEYVTGEATEPTAISTEAAEAIAKIEAEEKRPVADDILTRVR